MKEKAKTKKEMSEATVPWLKTTDELVEYINSLTDREHDGGTIPYAMSMAAMAAFYYVSRKLKASIMQGSVAGRDLIRRQRQIEGPFILIDSADMMFPGSDPHKKLADAMKIWRTWIAGEAKRLLKEQPKASPVAKAHWERLARGDE